MTSVQNKLNWNYEFDGEYHPIIGTIEASSEKEATELLSKKYPNDINSDGYFIHPLTGEDIAIDW